MFLAIHYANVGHHTGYVAGMGDGIVMVAEGTTARPIYVFETSSLQLVDVKMSQKNGQYLFTNLDPTKKYLLMCRDLPPDGVHERYEPFCWDYVVPMNDKTLAEQMAMWQQMTEN